MSSFLLSVFQNLIHEPLLEDKFMCAVISGIMCGAGIGISLVNGGSTAGTDIVAMISTSTGISVLVKLSCTSMCLSSDVVTLLGRIP